MHAQSLRKLERGSINRTRITLVNGDTIQRFTTTLRHPQPRPDRFYYWQGQDRIQRNAGGYNGHLLDGSYQLTDRDDHLLGNGALRQGLKTGTWRTWRPDGSLASTSHWRQGRQRGRTIAYDANSRPLPIAAPPKHSPAAPNAAAPVVRWWQPAYWKIKLKRRRATRAIPAPGSAPVTPAPMPKKKSGSKKEVLPPVTPKQAGS
ncbi:toxin-antitoxin system YwqK family antitoxin [Hymenobacter segetis]|uniref:Uncharacterized protein n=1 Tax=Hymenobacter segetis TaxID=2025509 RepID=A0ABU9LTU3_9BACT